jgi:excisionase family DNA binding protein
MAVTSPKDSMQPQEWLTVDQSAQLLQFNPMTILRWIKAGKLPASKLGKSYRIAMKDVTKYLNDRKVQP